MADKKEMEELVEESKENIENLRKAASEIRNHSLEVLEERTENIFESAIVMKMVIEDFKKEESFRKVINRLVASKEDLERVNNYKNEGVPFYID